MRSYFLIAPVAAAILATRVKAQAKDECYVPLDVVFLQDTTYGLSDLLKNVTSKLPQIFTTTLSRNPNSRFGLADFRDKPVSPFGDRDDYCYRLVESLSDNAAKISNAYKKLSTGRYRDEAEDAFQGILDVVYDDRVGWRPIVPDSKYAGHAGGRAVVLFTDAIPHIAGDRWIAEGRTQPLNPGPIKRNDFDRVCKQHDYASVDQVKAALKEQDVYLITVLLTYDGAVRQVWERINQGSLGQERDFLFSVEAGPGSSYPDWSLTVHNALRWIKWQACQSKISSDCFEVFGAALCNAYCKEHPNSWCSTTTTTRKTTTKRTTTRRTPTKRTTTRRTPTKRTTTTKRK